MDARIVAFVAARLLALYLVLGNALGFAVMALIGAFAPSGDYGWMGIATSVLAAIAYAAAGAVVWVSSRWISDRVAGRLKSVELSDSGPDRWKALSIAIAGAISLVTGLRILVKAIPALLMNATAENGMFNTPDPWRQVAVQVGFFLVLGIALIAFQNTIVRGINAARDWAGKPVINDGES